ncbi:MAG: hypothetical protein HDT40_01050 [Lachnospiraceae bacterium]|nr:hypothetical protein [Lachnospiraceae bacterium]
MKIRKLVCLITVCCLLAGCEKKHNDTQAVSDTSATDNVIDTTIDTVTTTEMVPENTEADTKNTDIPEDAVLKIVETTYKDDEVWLTYVKYRNAYDDVVGVATINSDGEEVFSRHDEYEYDESGKKIYAKTIWEAGEYAEIEYLSDNTEKGKHYDKRGRLEDETESTYDEYGNLIMSYTIVYDGDGEVALEIIKDYSDCYYDENGKIFVCRQRSESGEIISTTTTTYDDNGNILSSEEVYADSEKYGCYSVSHCYEYDDKNNLISEEEITKLNEDTVYHTESYEYQYDENGRKIREDYNEVYIYTDYDRNTSRYTIYEYTQL